MSGGMSARAMDWLEARGLDIEICDKLGLESQTGASGEALVYPAIRNGERIGSKYRPLIHQEGKPRFWRDKGTPSVAFNEDCLRDDSLIAHPLIITEGYEDAIVCLQAGFPRTISVPDGAPERPVDDIESSDKYAWIDPIYPLLKMDRVNEVVLAVDGDNAGAALLHDLAIKLGKSRCKFVKYPLARDSKARGRERLKDLNEVLEDYGARGVREVLGRATFLNVPGVYAMSELPPLPQDVIYEVGFDAFSNHFKLRLGDLSVWTGIGGYGKTTFINDLLCRVVFSHGLVVGWASFEQDPQRDHRRALRSWFWQEYEPKLTVQQKAEADRWIETHHRFLVPDDEEDATLDWLLEKMEMAVIRHGAKVIVIDPWNELEHDRRPGESETEYTNRAVRLLKRFAKRFQVHVMVVAHPTKIPRRDDGTYGCPGLYDIAGSAAWRNKPELGVIIHRADELTTIAKVEKSRHWSIIGRPGIVAMHFSEQTRRFTEVERNLPMDEDQKPRKKRYAA